MYLLQCRHCDHLYYENEELTKTVPDTRHEPGYEMYFCPNCNENAENNMEATPEQYQQKNQEPNNGKINS